MWSHTPDTELKFFRLHHNAKVPVYATRDSACFDVAASFAGKEWVSIYDDYGTEHDRSICSCLSAPPMGFVTIQPNHRALIPTNLILDIPRGYSVRLHARSGLSLKMGLALVNQEAVIDSDYVDELFVLVHNIGSRERYVRCGDRIAQGELVWTPSTTLSETLERPTQKTDRVGGLGSTGVQHAEVATFVEGYDK